jgi:hypothetical protein
MRTKVGALTLLLATAAGAVAISAAPMAAADPTSCNAVGPDSVCQTPGNVQINDSAPIQYAPEYPEFGVMGYPVASGHR